MIIGLTGTFGAGKGAVAAYLTDEKGFRHISARAFITEEIKRRGLPITRESMTEVANSLRATGGPTYLYEQLVGTAKELGGDVVVESIRAVAEVQYTKEHGGVVIGVDANPQLRYERMTARGTETDSVTYEEWIWQQEQESNTEDPTKQNIPGALKAADYIIENNGTLQELHAQVDSVLAKIAT